MSKLIRKYIKKHFKYDIYCFICNKNLKGYTPYLCNKHKRKAKKLLEEYDV